MKQVRGWSADAPASASASCLLVCVLGGSGSDLVRPSSCKGLSLPGLTWPGPVNRSVPLTLEIKRLFRTDGHAFIPDQTAPDHPCLQQIQCFTVNEPDLTSRNEIGTLGGRSQSLCVRSLRCEWNWRVVTVGTGPIRWLRSHFDVRIWHFLSIDRDFFLDLYTNQIEIPIQQNVKFHPTSAPGSTLRNAPRGNKCFSWKDPQLVSNPAQNYDVDSVTSTIHPGSVRSRQFPILPAQCIPIPRVTAHVLLSASGTEGAGARLDCEFIVDRKRLRDRCFSFH